MLHLSDVEAAAEVVRPVIHHTPLMTCRTIEDRLADGISLRLKAENFQRTGAFKIRGAYYRLTQLTDAEKRCGVAAVSAGNHAQGVALAAQLLGIQATIFMPETASIAKMKATEGYGAKVVLAGKNFDESAIACHRYVAENDAVYISPYDDDGVIAGQGTLGLEMLEDMPNVETVMVPIGGGGLFAGVALAIKEKRPHVRIIGVQAEGADTGARSFRAGHLLPREQPVNTICDGIAVKSPAARTFEYIQKYADDVVTVSDFAVAEAMLLLVERAKLIVEPSGAAGLAALISGKAAARGETAVILCGGNIDALRLADIAQREMLRADRYLHLFTACDDRPGSLARLLEIVAVERGNVITVSHNRLSPHISLSKTGIELLIEVRDRTHREIILAALRGDGYPVETLL